ncbi:hypothetical protein BJ508DRAFT_162195 [Ascobolus immersus RN42]|uniref:Uncharacterized protein n=1 Tax=Ascobolus immersus RN42 TaxID=1160509 RepID=A0A3N4HXQ5_ASCIM|nr:hypothetical protein BJ508DRAFT_162195 [Ascobolus immersus RN42]
MPNPFLDLTSIPLHSTYLSSPSSPASSCSTLYAPETHPFIFSRDPTQNIHRTRGYVCSCCYSFLPIIKGYTTVVTACQRLIEVPRPEKADEVTGGEDADALLTRVHELLVERKLLWCVEEEKRAVEVRMEGVVWRVVLLVGDLNIVTSN